MFRYRDPQKPKTVVQTTAAYPFPPTAARAELLTPRLRIRAPTASDFEAWRVLRADPEIMAHMGEGVPDSSVDESRASFAKLVAPNDSDTYVWLVFDRENGAFLGHGGVFDKEFYFTGWPTLSFSFVAEARGKGVATEFVAAFLKAWWALPRRTLTLNVEKEGFLATRDDGGQIVVTEQLNAMTWPENRASQIVLEKNDFKLWTRVWLVDQRPRSQAPGQELEVICWSFARPPVGSAKP
jgi:RimJ/RimL family protein N-acetyltransferase